MEKKNKRVKCPICGQFTNEDAVEAYESMKRKIAVLTTTLKDCEQQLLAVKDSLKKADESYDLLEYEYTEALKALEEKSKSLWDKIFG